MKIAQFQKTNLRIIRQNTRKVMNFALENYGSIVFLKLKNSNVDGQVAAQFKAKILIIAQPDIEALIIDLSDVEAIDSSGLGALLLAHRQLKDYGIPIILVGVRDFVKSLMSITRIDELFEYYDSLDEALATFKDEE